MKKYLLNTILIFLGIFILYKPPIDPDFGWHYKYGEYFVKNGKVLTENIFSYTFTDYKWANSYWMWEVVLYFLHSNLGHVVATTILSGILAAFILYICFKLTNVKWLAIVFYLIQLLGLSTFSIPIRSFYPSTFLLYILTWILIYKENYIKFIPLIFLLWVNLHADFTVGLFALGIYTFQKILESKKDIRNSVSVLLISALSLFATFINPYVIETWKTVLKEVIQTHKPLVGEFFPLYKQDATFYFLSFVIALYLLSLIKNKNLETWYKITAIFFLILGIKMVYFIRVFLIFGQFGLIATINYLTQRDITTKRVLKEVDKLVQKIKNNKWIYLYFKVLILSVIFQFCVVYHQKIQTTVEPKLFAIEGKYPYEALEHIKSNDQKGNMFNLYNWGGYIIWKYPQYKTFIDGRMPLWTENNEMAMIPYSKIITDFQNNKNIFDTYVSKYNITWILEDKEAKWVKELLKAESDKWEIFYKDDIAQILVKK